MASFTILEPMSTGDVIDRAVRLYRRNFTPLVAIAAVPTLILYVASLMVSYGYASLITGASNSGIFPIPAVMMLLLGIAGYPIWMYVLLLTVSGLSRVVGDHLMLGEPITFRRCWAAAKRRIGAITLMGLLFLVFFLGAYFVVGIAAFFGFLIVGLLAGAIAAAGLPQWVAGLMMIVLIIVAVGLALFLIMLVIARVIFFPQIVMIEGESAVNALGRAIRLGKGNWYRVAAIIVFTYFVLLSMQAALMLPVVFGLYLAGVLTPEFLVSPMGSVLYTSFRNMSELLSLPIWVVSFTLLYFDSRVRREAYDVDLLAREINPGFYWQPTVQASAFGYQMPVQSGYARSWVQTSPLGLAGYRPPARPDGVSQREEEPEDLRDKFERAARSLSEPEQPRSTVFPTGISDTERANCSECGAMLAQGARFCMHCGAALSG